MQHLLTYVSFGMFFYSLFLSDQETRHEPAFPSYVTY